MLTWSDDLSTLFLGLDSGLICRYLVDKKKGCMAMKELGDINVHNNQMRVMGIAVDARVNHMFSISESGYLIVTNLADPLTEKGKFMSSQNLSSSGLKAMIHDSVRNILVIASGAGEVFILNVLPSEPQTIIKLETDQRVCIRGLTRSISLNDDWVVPGQKLVKKGGLNQNLLLASDVNGYITIFDINSPGKEYLAKRVGNV